MRLSGVIIALMFLLALAGSIINLNLTRKHTSKATGPEWFASGCTPEDNPVYNCDEVMRTKWAVFSFRDRSFVEPDPETGSQPGTPVALLGWFYFTALAVWFAGIGRCSYERRFWHLLPAGALIAGCASSALFMYLLLARMDIKCFWCMVSHGINFLLLAGTVFVWPRRPAAPTPPPTSEDKLEQKTEIIPTPQAGIPHPTLRLVAVTVVCALALIYSEYTQALGDRFRFESKAYKAQLETIAKDTETQWAEYRTQKAIHIKRRPDDPTRGEGELLFQLVVFSDFQCPACRVFAQDIESKVRPAFDNLIEVIWRHYPICSHCNPHVRRDLHPHACEAARAAEAARLQGGNDAFWKAHDYFFANPKLFRTRKIDWGRVAADLEMDVRRFITDMQSEEVNKRIAEDVEEAHAIGIHSTPGVLLGGRFVRRYVFGNRPFIEKVNKWFLAQRHNALVNLEYQRRRRAASQPATQPPAKPKNQPASGTPPATSHE